MRTCRVLCGFFAFLQVTGHAIAGEDLASQLRVPDGFVVKRVAGPPLVEHPMMAGFDDRGRLFVAENAGVNLDFKQLQEQLPNKVLMLEDTDRDGTFDKRTVFADKLTFPSGALWHKGALYVTSVPGLWKFQDTDNDGVADRREQIVTGFGSIGNGADLHGPFLGPEGWLYFCNGRNGHDLTLGDGTKWKGKAACVYRCRPDGSGLEVVFGGGFDNPVEIAFTPEGEALVNVNIVESIPHRVDAILYGIEGSNYPHADVWRELKRTGEFQPTVGELGWVATSGFMRYRSAALGQKYFGRYFSTEFNPHRVRSHVVERDGAGFKITHEEFLTCDNPDFHPTDIFEDADGSLLVIDTGGWFRIGCPNSQIAKPDVKGAIYRVKRRDATPPTAAHEPPAPDERILTARMLNLTGGADAERQLLLRLTDAHPAVRREAASGLGRIRPKAAVLPLLSAAAAAGDDRFLQHAITFALIRIADRDVTRVGLLHKRPAARRAALIALDQMEGGDLTAELVVPHLASDHPPLREAAFGIVSAHPDWAGQVVPTIRTSLSKPELDAKDAEPVRAAVAAFVRTAPMQTLIADMLNADSTSAAARLLLLEAVSASGISPLPAAWEDPLRTSLTHADERVVHQAVDAIHASGADAFDAELLRLARDARRPAALRVAALSATMPRAKVTDAADFALLLAELAPEHAPLARLSAAQALGAAPLNNEQLTALAHALAAAGPLELPALTAAFERSSDAHVGAALVEALTKAKSLAGLTPAGLTQALAKYPSSVREAAAPLMDKINPDGAAQKARLAELEPLLAGGSPNRGQSVFFGKAAACATCHSIRGTGGHVGPDLSKIASIRAGRDLLESVVFPSISFARGYESYIVQTKSNQIHAGVLAAETADAIVLRTPAEVRVPRTSIKTIRQDRVSIMPQGLDALLAKQEMSDLLAFLQSLK